MGLSEPVSGPRVPVRHATRLIIPHQPPLPRTQIHLTSSHFRPPAPGEEVVLSLFPLSHVSNLMLDVYYILSVAGTSVFPGYDVFRVNKDKELWELFTEVRES